MSYKIVLACNNDYVPYMATTIQSLMANCNQNSTFDIYIFNRDIDFENQSLMKKQVDRYDNFKIYFIDVSNVFEQYDFVYQGTGIEAFYRLYIPYFFKDERKVLYLDSDMLCFSDIGELFEIDVEDVMVGAVNGLAEVGWYLSSKEHYWDTQLKLINPKLYFNSGLLLFNPKRFREFIDFEELMKLSCSQSFPCYDQDVLNFVCQGKVKFISYDWNFIKYHTASFLSENELSTYLIAEQNPKLIHFAKGLKPWDNMYYVPFSYDFWYYALNTPFDNKIKEYMNQKYTMFYKKELNINKMSLKEILKFVFQKAKKKYF